MWSKQALTLAAVGREGHDDLVPDLELGHVLADLDDLSDDLVARRRARLEGEMPAVEVQVGAWARQHVHREFSEPRGGRRWQCGVGWGPAVSQPEQRGTDFCTVRASVRAGCQAHEQPRRSGVRAPQAAGRRGHLFLLAPGRAPRPRATWSWEPAGRARTTRRTQQAAKHSMGLMRRATGQVREHASGQRQGCSAQRRATHRTVPQ